MCCTAGFAYLFGGWDGRKDLGDLWRLNTSTLKWECLSANTKDDVRHDVCLLNAWRGVCLFASVCH